MPIQARALALAALLCLAAPVVAQPAMPRCGPALEGEAWSNCTCGYDRGGLLAARPAGWRWTCDLLRGPGPAPPVQSAGDPAPGLPGGFTYAPQMGTPQTGTPQAGVSPMGAPSGPAGQSPMTLRPPFR